MFTADACSSVSNVQGFRPGIDGLPEELAVAWGFAVVVRVAKGLPTGLASPPAVGIVLSEGDAVAIAAFSDATTAGVAAATCVAP